MPLIGIVARADTTVLDAYLNPVLRDYVEGITARLPGSRVQLMTSVGGLVETSHFSGKDSLLSGPAGGVVGCATAAGIALTRCFGWPPGWREKCTEILPQTACVA